MTSITVSQETMNQLHDLAQHYGSTIKEALAIAVSGNHSAWERDYKGVTDEDLCGPRGETNIPPFPTGPNVRTIWDDPRFKEAMAESRK